jgi:hypothetical protein
MDSHLAVTGLYQRREVAIFHRMIDGTAYERFFVFINVCYIEETGGVSGGFDDQR